MAAELILEFEGVSLAQYDKVNQELGINPLTGAGSWPDGLQSHAAGLDANGALVVTEVWSTPAYQERFFNQRLAKALAHGNINSPPRARWIELVSHWMLK